MAIARKCDRCGKLYEEYICLLFEDQPVNAVSLLERSGNGIEGKEYFDLCEECCLEVLTWLRNPHMTVETKVYPTED